MYVSADEVEQCKKWCQFVEFNPWFWTNEYRKINL